MSRTFKDAPEVRRDRKARRFARLERQRKFTFVPSPQPVQPDREPDWDGIADTAMTGVAPAGTTSEERILRLLAAPCPHYGPGGQRISCTEAEDQDRHDYVLAELTAIRLPSDAEIIRATALTQIAGGW